MPSKSPILPHILLTRTAILKPGVKPFILMDGLVIKILLRSNKLKPGVMQLNPFFVPIKLLINAAIA